MRTATLPRLSSIGRILDTSPSHFGTLRSSAAIGDDFAALRQRMVEDGYLYIPGYLDRDRVIAARRDITETLAGEGYLEPDTPTMDAVARVVGAAEAQGRFARERRLRPDIVEQSGSLQDVLFGDRMIGWFVGFLDSNVRHFDFTWLRINPPGKGTEPHGDLPFMGRGTDQLYTAWVPFTDISYTVGGLIVLEHSHRIAHLRDFLHGDVDAFCANHDDAEEYASGRKSKNGNLSDDPVALRDQLGGRWLTAEYRMGDLLVFSMYTVHASLDNQSDRYRISTDTRYQRADDPIDERWVGPNPVGHTAGGKRGLIC